MDDIAGWLARISWPLVSRVMASLGFGTVTYVGADNALSSALGAAKSAFLGMSADILQIMAMAGFFDAMSIASGGIVSGLAWMVMKRFALQTGTA
jgi:hypothetical protein